MTLHFTLHVNGKSIHEGVHIQRTSSGRPLPDDVNTYVAQVKRDGTWRTTTVEHRYGDGPWELVRKVLNATSEAV
ncbi:hypothetical protein A3N99_02700 [Mycobacteroides abscessus]|uniref:hypothetical protein n=1 Tax=Mycobacteroides abscessus TaxID=36809 RepID=UPI00078D540C|nr:hypothetical protein [Mycobacteroides abscessus]AMU39221.1 hypothetical protein A3N99_02700 [Mycobacteroides abscessus]